MDRKASQGGSLTHSKEEQELRALMVKTQGGDGKAYNVLLVRIEKMLQSFVRKSIHIDNADDVIQEIILAIHAKRHTFNTEQFFLPWFYAIARYKVIDYIRAKSRNREVQVFDGESLDEFPASDASGVIDVMTVDDLEGILSHLPEKQREIVKSVKIQGLSIKEAAEKLNLSESDIKVNIHRALKTLKVMFSGAPQ
jgi:RNA polymerase sigma-70 factor (ECF subfamily)